MSDERVESVGNDVEVDPRLRGVRSRLNEGHALTLLAVGRQSGLEGAALPQVAAANLAGVAARIVLRRAPSRRVASLPALACWLVRPDR